MTTTPITESARAIHRVLLATKWGGRGHCGINDYTKAIDAAFVVIPRDELPEVKASETDPTTFYVSGTNAVFTSAKNARDWALADIAVWQLMESRESAEHAKRQHLAARRDELARELSEGVSPGYVGLSTFNKRALDRIIELEAAEK